MNAKHFLSLSLAALIGLGPVFTGIAQAEESKSPVIHLIKVIGAPRIPPTWVSPPGVNYNGRLPPPSVRCEPGFIPGIQRTPASHPGGVAGQRDLEQRTAVATAPNDGSWDGGYFIVQGTTSINGAIALWCLNPGMETNSSASATASATAVSCGYGTKVNAAGNGCENIECPANEQLTADGKACEPKPLICQPNEALYNDASTGEKICKPVTCKPTENLVLATKPGEDAKCVAKALPLVALSCPTDQAVSKDGKSCVDKKKSRPWLVPVVAGSAVVTAGIIFCAVFCPRPNDRGLNYTATTGSLTLMPTNPLGKVGNVTLVPGGFGF